MRPNRPRADGKGHIYVDVSDKANVAVIDAKTMSVTAHYDLGDKGAGVAGLALDIKNHVLFVACRLPAPGVMVMLNADDGRILAHPAARRQLRRCRVQSSDERSVQLLGPGRRHA